MTLRAIIDGLQKNQNVLQLFQNYRGNEWRSIVPYHHHIVSPKSVVLFRSDKQKLVLTGWNLLQYHWFPGNNAKIHTLVVEGSLYLRLQTPDELEKKILTPEMYLNSRPYTEWSLLCTKRAASLHLIQVHEDFHETNDMKRT